MILFKKKKESVFDRFRKMWENHPEEFNELTRMIIHHGLTIHDDNISLGSDSKGIEIYEEAKGEWDLVAQIPPTSFIKEVISV